MTRPAIRDRLVNWGLYVRVTARQGVSATAQVLDRLEEIAGKAPIRGYDESRPPREIDEVDGDLVEKAMRKCSGATRTLLKHIYVFRGKPDWICRELSIRHRPKSIFDIKRYHAETEIERVLEEQPLIAARIAELHRVPPK